MHRPEPTNDALRQTETMAERGFRLQRRPVIGALSGGALAGLGLSGVARADASFRVGIGRSPDPYVATLRAIAASGEWPGALLSGRTVIIKPNLVGPASASTGMTTDPHVVRAVVDLALRAGVGQIVIAEGGLQGANFTACAYDFFRTYDPGGRIRLADLNDEPVSLVPVPGGLAYRAVYVPRLIVDQTSIYITVGKLKTHAEAVATLSLKNQFGLPVIPPYSLPNEPWFRPRFHLHERGVHQTIVDLNLLRPSHFAIVDGVWGMEGQGPTQGSPVRMDMVVAGRNAVAVDRACLQAMGIAQERVPYLYYAAQKGLGPAALSAIQLAGDSVTPVTFAQATDLLPPLVWRPGINPASFSLGSGQDTTITCRLDARTDRVCLLRIEVIRTSETSSAITVVRTLRGWAPRASGIESVTWDGRADGGAFVAPGNYTVRAQAYYEAQPEPLIAYATSWVIVT
jgi:uncharacterized protein (DUF362 family)